MFEQIVLTVTGLFSTFFGGVIAFLFTRRKYEAEIIRLKIENQEAAVNVESSKIEQLQKLIDFYGEQIIYLQNQIKTQQDEINNLRAIISGSK